jgi:hypothetical protein
MAKVFKTPLAEKQQMMWAAHGTPLTVMAYLLTFRRGRRRTMSELSRGERLQLMLSPEELRAIDTWRFNSRMPSRAAAFRELLKRGLAAEGFEFAEQGSKSSDFGILGKGKQKG